MTEKSSTGPGSAAFAGPALFAVAAFAVPLALADHRYFAFIAGMTLIHILWARG